MRRKIVRSVVGSACVLTAGSAVAAIGMPDRFSFSFPSQAFASLQSDAALYPERSPRADSPVAQTASVLVPIAQPKRIVARVETPSDPEAAPQATPFSGFKLPTLITRAEAAAVDIDGPGFGAPTSSAEPTSQRIVLASADPNFAMPAARAQPMPAAPEAQVSPEMPLALTAEMIFDPNIDPRATALTFAALTIADPASSADKPVDAKPPTPAELLGLTGKDRVKAEKCLAQAIYFEARNESARGQIAVAQVVMNRVFSPYYPKDVCSVVYQNAHRLLSCQFTFACDGQPEAIRERGAWIRAQRIAKQTLDAKVWLKDVAKSTHYHASYVRPNWVREMRKMARYGLHTFYRPHYWGDGSREQGWVTLAEAKKKGS